MKSPGPVMKHKWYLAKNITAKKNDSKLGFETNSNKIGSNLNVCVVLGIMHEGDTFSL